MVTIARKVMINSGLQGHVPSLPGNAGWISVKLTKSLLVETVPDIDESVRPARSEGVVLPVHNGGVIEYTMEG